MLETEIKNLIEAVRVLTNVLCEKTNISIVGIFDDTKAKSAELKTVETVKTELEATESDLKTAILNYAEEHGRDEAKKLLKSFGASKLSDITKDKRREVIDATL